MYWTAFGKTIIKEQPCRYIALLCLSYGDIPFKFALIIIYVVSTTSRKFFNKEKMGLLNCRCDWLIVLKIRTTWEPNWSIQRPHGTPFSNACFIIHKSKLFVLIALFDCSISFQKQPAPFYYWNPFNSNLHVFIPFFVHMWL